MRIPLFSKILQNLSNFIIPKFTRLDFASFTPLMLTTVIMAYFVRSLIAMQKLTLTWSS